MNKDSNHSLLHWTSPVGSLLNSSLLGLPLKNHVHPPPSTAPTSENPGPSYHSGTPSSTSRVNNYLVSLLLHPLADHSIIPLVSRFMFPRRRHYTVNKLFNWIRECHKITRSYARVKYE
ncbi:hypothetical protein CHARACLAT_033550 [Characodon lateralis]|uniref:Uncharacterized protein n=1 Tax=Characodon lateralis TaxID=208331 RepID=A0ABU7E5P8_9TELE|nr:hypothetical protein [Characodon lateralis]